MRRASLVSGLTAVLAVSLAAVTGAAEPARPALRPAIRTIVQRFVADNTGVLVSRQNVVYEQVAPGKNVHDEKDFSVLQQDRKTVAVRLHRLVDNRHLESAGELARSQAAVDKQYAGTPRVDTRYRLPYYPESASEYTFSAPRPCAGCPPAAMTIAFKSSANDDRHVQGTMTFDQLTSRPTKLEFVPNVLPKPATTGKVTFTYGAYDDGGWGVVRIDEHYSGHMLLTSGTTDRTTILRARHYATVEEARRALQAG
jgi:hypothetical protein